MEHEALSIFPLGACANLPLATPGYFSRFGTPHEPEDLAGHTLLLAKRPHSALCGTLFRGGEEFSLIEMRRVGSAGRRAGPRPRRVVSGYYPTLLAALRGQGIAFDLALGMVADRLQRRELVRCSSGADKGSGKALDQGVRRLVPGL